MRIVIVGGGMAGAACASRLALAGHETLVLDKGRSVGGRLAQRRVGDAQIDHGAQYLTAAEPAFAAQVAAWQDEGLLAPWPGAATGRGLPAWTGVPSMAAPVRAMLAGSTVRCGQQVVRVQLAAGAWSAVTGSGEVHGPADALVLAIPAPQARALLLASGETETALDIAGVAIAPCWSALLVPSHPIGAAWASRRLTDGPLVWAARNDSKPGRNPVESWTLHAGPGWSADHLEAEAAAIAPRLIDAFRAQCGVTVTEPVHLAAHRWRYALVTAPLGRDACYDPERRLGLCGDWCLGPRVEAAWQSGRALAERILR